MPCRHHAWPTIIGRVASGYRWGKALQSGVPVCEAAWDKLAGTGAGGNSSDPVHDTVPIVQWKFHDRSKIRNILEAVIRSKIEAGVVGTS